LPDFSIFILDAKVAYRTEMRSDPKNPPSTDVEGGFCLNICKRPFSNCVTIVFPSWFRRLIKPAARRTL